MSTTKFNIWKDETYQGRPEKILVINTFQNPATRRLFEDEFVKALKDYKVDAVVSYTFMPDPIVSDKGTIAAQAKKVGADAVLIHKPRGKSEDETIGAGGVRYFDEYIYSQIDVYDMKSNRLIMTISMETWTNRENPYVKQIQSFVKDIVNKMSRSGLF
jgi:hypothetical protein